MAKQGAQLCLQIIYSFFLLITVVLATVAAAVPYWIVNDTAGSPLVEACGPVTFCPKGAELEDCGRYGDSPEDIPIEYWRYTAGFFILAIIFLWICWVFSIFTCCCCYGCIRMHGPNLILAGIFVIVAMCLFGAGLEDVGDCLIVCNNAESFDSGSCDLGYGGGFAVAATVMTFICAGISFALKPEPDHLA